MTGKKMKVKTAFLLLLIFVGIFLSEESVLAQEPQFRIDIDTLNVQKGVSTSLVISIENANKANVKEIKGLENFDVLSTSQSTSTQIINGATTYRKEIHYVIMAKSTGEFTLQGSVEYEGSVYKTNALEINVSETSHDEKTDTKDLFIETNISNDEIYLGQKVVIEYDLYSRYNIENFGFLDEINFDGCIVSDVPQEDLDADFIYINGNKYINYTVKQTYLIPIESGTYTIPSYNFQVNVSTDSFFNSSKPFYLQTESKDLNVEPLPVEGQPANFSGIVGKLDLEASYSAREVEYGDSLTLNVTVSGDCNLEGLTKIIHDDIPDFSIYETEKESEESIEDNQYKAKKEFEIILVPEKNGDITIDPIYISYFDTESKNYQEAKIDGTTIKVNGEIPQIETQEPNEVTKVDTVKIEQVNYQNQSEEYITLELKKSHLVIGLVIFIVLLIIGVLVFLIIKYRKKQDTKIKAIYKQIKNSDNQSEIYNLFNHMIKYRYNISIKASSRDEIINRLKEYDLVDPVLEVVDYMENEKYTSNKGNMNVKEKIKTIYKQMK